MTGKRFPIAWCCTSQNFIWMEDKLDLLFIEYGRCHSTMDDIAGLNMEWKNMGEIKKIGIVTDKN